MPLPTYPHLSSGRRAWVKIHPRDTLVGLPRVYLTNPEDFTPQLDPHTGKYETWGINDQEDDSKDSTGIPKFFQRQMMVDMLYLGQDQPQSQFINILIDRKEKQLAARDRGDRAKRDYVLHISMPGITDKDGKEFIWRRFRVSGAMKLNLLQDKVIQPTMGWARNYHGYVFTDRTDGALFGPKDAGHIDMMHIRMNGHEYIPDDKYTIADILESEGSTLGYMYDLGDHWVHEIAVEKILPVSESNGRFELIAGSGACPAEDMQGNHTWVETLATLRTNPKDRDIMQEIHGSLNYRDDRAVHRPGWFYDPHKFDLGVARRRVAEALASRASVPSGAKTGVFSLLDPHGSPEGIGNFRGNQPRNSKMVYTSNEDYGGAGYLQEAVRKGKEPKSLALCENCGKPDGLKRCAGCAKVWYCSKECQHTRWREHKPKCGGAPSGSTKSAASTSSSRANRDPRPKVDL